MIIEKIKEMIGKEVMTDDTGVKLTKRLAPHGPYKILQVTRGGKVLLQKGKEVISVAPSNIIIEGYIRKSDRQCGCNCKRK